MMDGINFFDQPIKTDFKTYINIRKIATDEGDDYTIGYLVAYHYFKKYYSLIAIYLSKQLKLDADPIVLQQINFTGNLDRAGNAIIMYLIIEEKIF